MAYPNTLDGRPSFSEESCGVGTHQEALASKEETLALHPFGFQPQPKRDTAGCRQHGSEATGAGTWSLSRPVHCWTPSGAISITAGARHTPGAHGHSCVLGKQTVVPHLQELPGRPTANPTTWPQAKLHEPWPSQGANRHPGGGKVGRFLTADKRVTPGPISP